MNRNQATHLANFINSIRPDWHTPGIFATLGNNRTKTSPADLAKTLIDLSQDPDNRTPAVLDHHDFDQQPAAFRRTPTGRPEPCPIPDHARANRLASNCPQCWRWSDFPAVIEADVFARLDPAVQRKVSAAENVRVQP